MNAIQVRFLTSVFWRLSPSFASSVKTLLVGRPPNRSKPILAILAQAKGLAREYRAVTGKPLGITGEVAEYEAARILDIELTPARHAGYDGVRKSDGRRYQIKGRCLMPDCKPGQRLDRIDTKKEFDAVLLVLLDDRFDALAIYEAERVPVLAALTAPGSKARNERGALSLSKFKSIGRLVWEKPSVEGRECPDSSTSNGHRSGHTRGQ